MTIIRNAEPDDIAGIADIYNHAVVNTTAIWNSVTVDVANRLQWWTERQAKGYPVLVASEAAGDVIGYASFGDWRAFNGYRHTVENSVYVHHEHRGKGAGSALLKALIERAVLLDKHVMVAGIEAENYSSLHLHRKSGFVQVGMFPEVGTKFGRWLDLVFMQLILDSPAKC